MTTKFKFRVIIIALILVIIGLVFSLFDGCSKRKEFKNLVEQYEDYKHESETYVTEQGRLVAKNKTLETTMEILEMANDTLVDYIKDLELKKPETIVIYDTRTQVDTLEILTTEKIPCDSTFSIPFEEVDSNYTIAGTVENNDSVSLVSLDQVMFPNRTSVILSKEKGLFKNDYIATVHHSNPLINTGGITSMKIKDPRKWYQKWWFPLIIGVVSGGVGTWAVIKYGK